LRLTYQNINNKTKLIFLLITILLLLAGCSSSTNGVGPVNSEKINKVQNLPDSKFEIVSVDIWVANPMNMDLDEAEDVILLIFILKEPDMESYHAKVGEKHPEGTVDAKLYSRENGELIEEWNNVEIYSFRSSMAGDYPVFVLEFKDELQKETLANLEATFITSGKEFSAKEELIRLKKIEKDDVGVEKIPGLSYFESRLSTENWDSDAEKDGLINSIYFWDMHPQPFSGKIETSIYNSETKQLIEAWETTFSENDYELETYSEDNLGNKSIKLTYKMNYIKPIDEYPDVAEATIKLTIDSVTYTQTIKTVRLK